MGVSIQGEQTFVCRVGKLRNEPRVGPEVSFHLHELHPKEPYIEYEPNQLQQVNDDIQCGVFGGQSEYVP
jgi:hypothetical protein